MNTANKFHAIADQHFASTPKAKPATTRTRRTVARDLDGTEADQWLTGQPSGFRSFDDANWA